MRNIDSKKKIMEHLEFGDFYGRDLVDIKNKCESMIKDMEKKK